ncbi:MAG: hypothetical protein ACQETE_13225 [Bacteroidota bacterium]
MTKSAYTLSEVAYLVHRTVEQVEEDIQNGALSYSIIDGKQMVTLYDLQRYKLWMSKLSTPLLSRSTNSIDVGAPGVE